MNKKEFLALSDNEKIRTLSGTAYWSHLQSPDTRTAKKFNSTPYYQLSLALDPAGEKLAEEYGLKIYPATDTITTPYVRIKRKVKDETNPSASRPDLVDSVQKPIPNNILIGNGSKVTCKFGTYWYDAQGGGVGTSLFKVQVTDLVQYKGADVSPDGTRIDSDLSIDDSGWVVSDVSEDEDEDIFDVA